MTCGLCGRDCLPAASVCGTCFVRLFDGTVGRSFGYDKAVQTGPERRVSMARKRRARQRGAPSLPSGKTHNPQAPGSYQGATT